jgi:hypothetical protein
MNSTKIPEAVEMHASFAIQRVTSHAMRDNLSSVIENCESLTDKL